MGECGVLKINNMVYNSFLKQNKKQLVLLIDPDKHSDASLKLVSTIAQKEGVHYIFVGGSLLNSNIEHAISIIKNQYKGSVVLFPGNACQVSPNADAILFLSLISGRNPEFLIGNHVIAAPIIKQSNLEVIPTGYILVECGNTTSVEYMSNTRPIPNNKPDIAIATALAGEMLGLKALYIEAGSGAEHIVNPEIISGVKTHTTIPIIVGGGIRSVEDLQIVYNAGADIAVVGTIIEKQPELLSAMMKLVRA